MTHVETDQFGSKQLAPLRTNPLYTDYTLLAEDVEFPVHRAILVCVSDYFRDLFERGGDRAELEGMTAEGLRGVLHLLYRGTVLMDEENVGEILQASKCLRIQHLQDLCEGFQLHLKPVAELDLEEVAESGHFNALSFDQLTKVMKRDRKKLLGTFGVTTWVMGWLDTHPEVNKSDVLRFLPK